MDVSVIYFGHPTSTYDTGLEDRLMGILEQRFSGWRVENPNSRGHNEAYMRWKDENGSGMGYYFSRVLPKMDAGAFLAFEDGMFGAGVYSEAEWLLEHGRPIFEVRADGGVVTLVLEESRRLSIDETRVRLKAAKLVSDSWSNR